MPGAKKIFVCLLVLAVSLLPASVTSADEGRSSSGSISAGSGLLEEIPLLTPFTGAALEISERIPDYQYVFIYPPHYSAVVMVVAPQENSIKVDRFEQTLPSENLPAAPLPPTGSRLYTTF